ncbi:hypothetical protein ACHAW6_001328 [Cyclotella cf. meneghiniana]
MLLNLCSHSCPDVVFAVHQVSKYTFKPSCHDELALVWIGLFLKGTKDEGLIMSPTPDPYSECYSMLTLLGSMDMRTRRILIVLAVGLVTLL